MQGESRELVLRLGFLGNLHSQLATLWQHLGFWPGPEDDVGCSEGHPGWLLRSYLHDGRLPDAGAIAGDFYCEPALPGLQQTKSNCSAVQRCLAASVVACSQVQTPAWLSSG